MAQPPKPKRRSPDEIAASVLGGKPSRPPRTNQLDEYVRQQTGARRSPDEIAQSVLGRLPKPSLPSQIGAGVAGVLAMPQTLARQTVTNLMGIGKSEEEKRKLQARSEEFDAASAALTGMPSLRPRRKSLQQTFEVARGLASIPGEIVKYGALSMVPSVGLPAAAALGAAEAAGGQAETSLPAMLSRAAGSAGMPRAEQALKRVSESAISRALFDVGAGEAFAAGVKGIAGGARTARQMRGLADVRVPLDESAAIGAPRFGPVAPPSLAFPDAFPREAKQVRGLIPAQTGRPPRPAPDTGPSGTSVLQPESWRNQQLREAIQWAEQQRAQRRETQFAEEQAARAMPQQGQVRGLLPAETGRQLRYGAMPDEAPTPTTPTRQLAPEPTRPQAPEASRPVEQVEIPSEVPATPKSTLASLQENLRARQNPSFDRVFDSPKPIPVEERSSARILVAPNGTRTLVVTVKDLYGNDQIESMFTATEKSKKGMAYLKKMTDQYVDQTGKTVAEQRIDTPEMFQQELDRLDVLRKRRIGADPDMQESLAFTEEMDALETLLKDAISGVGNKAARKSMLVGVDQIMRDNLFRVHPDLRDYARRLLLRRLPDMSPEDIRAFIKSARPHDTSGFNEMLTRLAKQDAMSKAYRLDDIFEWTNNYYWNHKNPNAEYFGSAIEEMRNLFGGFRKGGVAPVPLPPAGEGMSATQMWNLVRSPRDLRGMSDEQLQQLSKAAPEALQIMSQRGTSEEWQRLSRMEEEVNKEIIARRMKRGEELAYAPPAPAVERPDVVAFGPQERVPVRYRIVDARSLVPSHSPSTFQPNPNYPKGVQGRNYDTDVAAQRNVESAAQNLDPDPLLDQTITPQSGAPVVTPSGVVVAGNQRSMIIARSIDSAPQRYAAYVQRLRQNAARYGLTADDFAGVERPVLVREMDEAGDEALATLNRLSDVAQTKAKSPLDDAAARFQALRAAPRPLQTLTEKMGDEETLNAFLDRADGQRFVRELVEDGVIAPQEMGRYLADVDRGILNEEGKSLVQRMVLLAAVEDPVVVGRAPASVLQKLEGSAPYIVRSAADEEWNVAPLVRNALAVLTEARDKGLRVADLLSQVSAFDAPIPPAVQRMALFLSEARPTVVKQAFRRYSTAASEARGQAAYGADMFGNVAESAEQAQARLFGQPRTDMAGAVGLGLGQAGAGATAGALTAEDDAAQQDVIDRMVLYGLMAGGTGMAGYRAYRAIRGQRPPAPPDPSVVTPAMQRVGETIFRGGQPRVGPTLRQRIVELPPRVKQALKTFRTDWVEESRPLIRAGREAAGATGQRQVQEQIAYAHGALGSAKQYLMDRLGPVLRDMSDDQLQAVGVLLKGRREADIRAIYGPHKADVDNATLAKAVADAEAQPAVKRAADEVNKLFADLLEMRHDAGLLTDEQYFRIVNSEGAYVAYIKELADDIATGGPMGMLAGSQGGKFARATSGVRKMDRTKANIARTLDPLEAVAMAAAKTMQDVKKQQVASTVLDLVETANLPWIRRVKGDPTQPLGKHQFKQIRDGVLRIYEVEPEYADFVQAIAGQDAYSQAWYWRTMRAMKQLKTGGVTLEPTFQLFNVIRDTIMSGIQRADFARGMAESAIGGAIGGTTGAVYGDEPSDVLKGVAYGASVGLYARPLLNSLRAFGDIVGNRDIYQDFLRDGGSTEGFYVRNADDAHQFIQRMTKGRGVPNLLTPKGWYDVLSFIGGAGEQATRLAAYREAKEAGLSTGEAVMAAQDRTLRFSNRGGSQAAKNLASVTPFWNAKMQGWDKLARLLKDPKTYGAASVMITAPSVALWFENKDNPLYWQRPQWERNLFWLVPTPDKQEFVRIPKPFEIGFMFGSSFERVLDYAAQRGIITSAAPVMAEPERVLGRTIIDIVSTTGEGTIPVPPIISTPAQLLFDRDMFRNRRIVTRPDLPAELQAQPETSALARGAASTFGVAPEKVDFLLRDVGGTMGAEGARVLDMAARASGIPASEPSGGLPFFGRAELRFITQNRGQTESEVAARERLRRLERVDAGYKEVRKTGDPALLRQYILENRNDLLTLRQLRRPTATQRSLVRQLDDLQSLRRRVQQDKRFTADQRKDILGRIRLKSAQVADRINAMPPGGVAPSPR